MRYVELSPTLAKRFETPVPARSLTVRDARRADLPAVVQLAPDKINNQVQSPINKRIMVGLMIDHGTVVVAEDADGSVVGSCVMARRPNHDVEIGWSVDPRHRGRGHATAMVEAVMTRLFETGVERVQCTIEEDNAASLGIATKLELRQVPGWLEGTRSFERDLTDHTARLGAKPPSP